MENFFEKDNRISHEPERVVLSAVLFEGEIYKGKTHMNAIRELEKVHPDWDSDDVKMEGLKEGFLTSTGRFVDRTLAAGIGRRAGQIDMSDETDIMTSEDLDR